MDIKISEDRAGLHTPVREVPGSNLCRVNLTEIFSENNIFWDVRLCSPVEIDPCSREAYWLHLQGQKTSQASSQ
jgi:hypothetical protein